MANITIIVTDKRSPDPLIYTFTDPGLTRNAVTGEHEDYDKRMIAACSAARGSNASLDMDNQKLVLALTGSLTVVADPRGTRRGK